MRTDNGFKFCGGEFGNFCKNHEIVRYHTVRHNPRQNGLAELRNRTRDRKKHDECSQMLA